MLAAEEHIAESGDEAPEPETDAAVGQPDSSASDGSTDIDEGTQAKVEPTDPKAATVSVTSAEGKQETRKKKIGAGVIVAIVLLILLFFVAVGIAAWFLGKRRRGAKTEKVCVTVRLPIAGSALRGCRRHSCLVRLLATLLKGSVA